jgi:hypothetical protein
MRRRVDWRACLKNSSFTVPRGQQPANTPIRLDLHIHSKDHCAKPQRAILRRKRSRVVRHPTDGAALTEAHEFSDESGLAHSPLLNWPSSSKKDPHP